MKAPYIPCGRQGHADYIVTVFFQGRLKFSDFIKEYQIVNMETGRIAVHADLIDHLLGTAYTQFPANHQNIYHVLFDQLP